MTPYCTEDMELRRTVLVETGSLSHVSEMPNETYEDMNIIYSPFVSETTECKCAIYFNLECMCVKYYFSICHAIFQILVSAVNSV